MIVQWDQVITQSVTTGIPIVGSLLLYLWRRSEAAKKEQEQRHEENKASIGAIAREVNDFKNEAQFLPQHYHQEAFAAEDGPLTTKGIIRRPNG